MPRCIGGRGHNDTSPEITATTLSTTARILTTNYRQTTSETKPIAILQFNFNHKNHNNFNHEENFICIRSIDNAVGSEC